MKKEIRIYYESLEQGAHFIKPILDNIIKELKINLDVKLVKLIGSYKHYSKRIAPIIFWKNPDILITIVGKEEIPLIILEFSSAVFTEDHELQRFDGMVASADNNCIYVKVSPLTKKSSSQHGGNIDFDYIGPFGLINKKYDKLFYHFDWKSKEGVMEVNKDYLSCPNKINELKLLFKEVIQININYDQWIKKVENGLKKIKYFKEWFNKTNTFIFPNLENLNTSRTRWVKEILTLELKLNRFGHAMDPERGMLSYYGTLYPKIISKMFFYERNNAWYKDTPKEEEINKYLEKNGLKNAYDFLYCFMLGSGLYKNKYFSKLVDNYKNKRCKNFKINLSAFLKSHYPYLNKALRTIFKFSKSFYIEDLKGDKRILFEWEDCIKIEKYENNPSVTNIKEKSFLGEDDITYISVHNILKPNDYKILAVSYPGAQGDRVILAAPGTGKRQQRRYIDIISYLPNKFTSLQENKGIFFSKKIQKEINELSKYKTKEDYKDALKNFLRKFDQNALKGIIKIGFGFWSNKEFKLDKIKNLDLKELDYFIYVNREMNKWKIWRSGNSNLFKINEGKVSIPKSFEIIKIKK